MTDCKLSVLDLMESLSDGKAKPEEERQSVSAVQAQ